MFFENVWEPCIELFQVQLLLFDMVEPQENLWSLIIHFCTFCAVAYCWKEYKLSKFNQA